MAAERRRGRARWGLAAGGLALGAGLLLLTGGPIAWPFDALLNLGAVPAIEGARPPADGRVRVVVLQHGLFRTPASLGRLQRALEAHGYEVLNPGYRSTRGTIAEHARALAAVLDGRRARGPVDEWRFVGHSLGGLVIQEYLRQSDAVQPRACVYLATPHRGAMLADLRRHWFLFRWLMGTEAAFQLSPGDPFHRQPLPWLERSGAIAGDLGEGNAWIPGADDGTVAVGEAELPPPAANLRLPVGHTGIAADARVLRQVLWFLAHGAFAPGTRSQ